MHLSPPQRLSIWEIELGGQAGNDGKREWVGASVSKMAPDFRRQLPLPLPSPAMYGPGFVYFSAPTEQII